MITTRKGSRTCSSCLLKLELCIISLLILFCRSNGKSKSSKSKSSKTIEDVEDEGLAMLIPDIQKTAVLVQKAVADLVSRLGPSDVEMREDEGAIVLVVKTLEERYLEEMKKLQFGKSIRTILIKNEAVPVNHHYCLFSLRLPGFYDMIAEDEETGGIRFTVSHHYEGNVRNNWSRNSPARLKRLAQENVTLSTSLPLAYGSTIFVRCDTGRLDIMKVNNLC